MTKIQLYGYSEVLTAVVEAVKQFKDPLEENTPLLYDGNVADFLPERDRIGMYGGILAVVLLKEIPEIKGVGEEIATFTGELYTFIPGSDGDAVRKCLRYCDISRGYLSKPSLLDLKGTTTKVLEKYPNRFRNLNLSTLFGTNQPMFVKSGLTSFTVEKEIDPTFYDL